MRVESLTSRWGWRYPRCPGWPAKETRLPARHPPLTKPWCRVPPHCALIMYATVLSPPNWHHLHRYLKNSTSLATVSHCTTQLYHYAPQSLEHLPTLAVDPRDAAFTPKSRQTKYIPRKYGNLHVYRMHSEPLTRPARQDSIVVNWNIYKLSRVNYRPDVTINVWTQVKDEKIIFINRFGLFWYKSISVEHHCIHTPDSGGVNPLLTSNNAFIIQNFARI